MADSKGLDLLNKIADIISKPKAATPGKELEESPADDYIMAKKMVEKADPVKRKKAADSMKKAFGGK
jgi:hypothetical protein